MYIKFLKIILLLFFITSSVQSAESNKLLLSEEANWPPYTYELSGKATKGISFDIMSELFKRLNIPFEIELFPINRCLMQMKYGSRDAITLISKTSEREIFMEFSDPIIECPGYIYYDSKYTKPFNWSSFLDFKNYEIGIVMGYNYGTEFKTAYDLGIIKTQSVINIEQNFKKLLSGRVNFILANQSEASEFLKNFPKYKNRLKPMGNPYIVYFYCLGFSKNSKYVSLIPYINQVVAEMKNDGTIQKIVNKHILLPY